MEILTFFVNFWLNQIENYSIRINKMKDGILSFQLKKNWFSQTLADDAGHTIKGMIKENSQKNRSDQYHVI